MRFSFGQALLYRSQGHELRLCHSAWLELELQKGPLPGFLYADESGSCLVGGDWEEGLGEGYPNEFTESVRVRYTMHLRCQADDVVSD